jgi:hypothetical protein
LNCSQQIQLKIADLLISPTNTTESSADYTISFEALGSFKNVTWILRDKAANNNTGLDIDVSANPNYSFHVDNSIAYTKDENRFYLTASSQQVISTTNNVSLSTSLCGANDAILVIDESQSGITYGAEVNGKYYPNLAQGNGSDLLLSVDNKWLMDGNNTIKIKANSGCSQQFLTEVVQVNKKAQYTISSTINATACKEGPVTLSASSNQSDATYRWYSSISSTSILGTEADFLTPNLSDSTTYYVAAVSPDGCEGQREAVIANIGSGKSNIHISNPVNTICKGQSITLSVTGSEEGEFKWYESPISLQPLSTSSEFSTPPLSESTEYYVSYTNVLGCESERIKVMATVKKFNPKIYALSEKEIICSGGSNVFTAAGAPEGSSYRWFQNIEDETPLAQSEIFETGMVKESRKYYLEAINELGCVSNRIAIEAKVDISDPSKDIGPSIDKACQNSNVTLSVKGASDGSRYRWYSPNSINTPIVEGLSTTWDELSYATKYYVSALNENGCEGSKREFKLNVIQFADARIDSVSSGQLISNFDSGNQWYFNDELVSEKRTVVADKSGTSETARENTVNMVTGLGDEAKELFIYPNPATDYLYLSYNVNEKIDPQLYDMNGRLVKEFVLEKEGVLNNARADVRYLSSGIYLLRIKTEQSIIVRRIVIK